MTDDEWDDEIESYEPLPPPKPRAALFDVDANQVTPWTTADSGDSVVFTWSKPRMSVRSGIALLPFGPVVYGDRYLSVSEGDTVTVPLDLRFTAA
jgi:hypothetical protein